MYLKAEAFVGASGILFILLGYMNLAIVAVIIGLILHFARFKKKENQEILYETEEIYNKTKSSLITLGRLSNKSKFFRNVFISYWAGKEIEDKRDCLEGKIAYALANSSLNANSALNSILLIKREEKLKQEKEKVLNRAKAMNSIAWLGISFFFPFFSGIGISIMKESSIISGISQSSYSLFLSGTLIYMLEAIFANSIFQNIENGLYYGIISSILPISIALFVFNIASLFSSIL